MFNNIGPTNSIRQTKSKTSLVNTEGAELSVEHERAVAMRLKNVTSNKGQNIIEYAMIAAIVTAAIVAMSTYVFRSVQATQQAIQKEFRNQ